MNIVLDLIGNVRNHLHRFAEILAAPLLADHGFVNLAGSEVVDLLHLGSDEAFIVAEIEISLCAIIGDEHFTVLERTHRSRIHIDVRVEFN
jgi:hypothetical protein